MYLIIGVIAYFIILKIIGKFKIKKIYNNINSKDDLFNLHPRDFEFIVGEFFKRLGYKVKVTKYLRDGGKDLILNGDTYVEIKKYAFNHLIDKQIVEKLLKVMKRDMIQKGMIVTLSNFNTTARELCEQYGIVCIDGNMLINKIKAGN